MKRFDVPICENPLKTRDDFLRAAEQICNPLKPYYSKGCARLHIGNTSASYPDSIAEMEGFSRVLWGLVPLMAGGDEYDLWDVYLQGIKNGTNPAHEEYWGDITDYDQRMVEMAVFGLALALIPEKIWTPLSEQEKHHFASWLNQINHHQIHDCNWLFFLVLVNLGLKKAGAPYDSEKMDKNLERIDQFYISDGWYSDGLNGHCDYYIPFAIHFYGLIYAKLMESDDPERSKRYKSRAETFAKDFIYWFAQDGSAVPYGRSLTYRFAQSAFWSAMVFAEAEPFSMGIMKGMILRNLRWWFKQPIFNSDGILTIGYTYPNLIMAENYNSPGSPYWALKTFLPLALKGDHPFWQAEESPLPALNVRSVQQPPHLVICRQEEKNHVLAFNSGHLSTNEHTHTSAKYEKFVYSNVFGFSVPRAEWGLEQGAFDSMLALSEGDNLYRVKRTSEAYKIEGDIIYTQWKPWTDVVVKTWLVTGAPWHIRIHCIHTKRYIIAADGGFALGIENNNKDKSYKVMQSEKEVLARSPQGTSGIKSLYGNGKAELIYPNSNTNLMNSRTVIPTVKADIVPGTSWLISAVFGDPGYDPGMNNWDTAPYVDIVKNEIMIYSRDLNKIVFQKKMI
ncbi:DUF2264 domain-containing protein [Paenactinomyces guangxiensis]|uniref:DUF2264 domain-containing protein n=1 Tax=Paenactinomyces guangxiensis TaxID=1490290 RepID=A0A7W2A7P1_9BACL|nr:DUF2264 domain-containing protein [Paenactinomyces guangxiensis]MBA4493322.1 DUF2264 domain-containing protein [Paenactinomyces guangxiensis]MBH8589827.1 DUF2264 domain-containing protein [Paenactinomyces guangxiensis]